MGEFKSLYCSFCGRPGDKKTVLIKGSANGEAYICMDCVMSCVSMDTSNEFQLPKLDGLMKPKQIKAYLDEYVIGQDAAKKVLSVAVYNHYKRIASTTLMNEMEVDVQKSNVLLVGPTGSGKTYLAQTLARLLDVPFAIADATTLTEAGYVGEDVENVLLRLIQAADYDISKAEKGIIYIDEIDKIARKSESTSITRDVSGEGVQQALLKILEGTVAAVPPQGGRKHPSQETLKINTKNILFICGGAFAGIEKMVNSRTEVQTTMGFGSVVRGKDGSKSITEAFKEILPQDFVKYGLIPELLGRLPVICSLEQLDRDAMVRIMTEPKNALCRQYEFMVGLDDCRLSFEEGAIEKMADVALERNVGARGLRAIMENIMNDAMYECPDDDVSEIIVTVASVTGEGDVKYVKAS